MKKYNKRYTRAQLERLTTLQLREICYQEKIVKGIANSLDRHGFINAILNFRGANEDFIIKKYDEVAFGRLKTFIAGNLGVSQRPKFAIANPAKVTVYQTLAIEPRDAYVVLTDYKELAQTNVLLVNEKSELCGVFHLLSSPEEKGILYLCKSAQMPVTVTNTKNCRLLYLKQEDSEYLFGVYNNSTTSKRPINYYEVSLPNIDVNELKVSRETLAIDFGTSNTTAGIYLSSVAKNDFSQHDILNGRLKMNDINYVMFKNVASENEEWTPLLPTIVGVQNCANPDNIKLQFGYEVVQHDNLTGGNDLSTTFYEIKRWVNSFDDAVEIGDSNGNISSMKKGQIIGAYIKYVIDHAKQQFKCDFTHLHISSPVKLKKQFIQMFKDVLGNYTFEEEYALDEGVSVLYNTIASQISKGTFDDGKKHKALIIDCGGGTTDLSSCTFSIKENRINYEINVNTTYENGDTNFGGNNLTYRTMQYLKILITEGSLSKNQKPIYEQVMEVLIGDVYRYLDEHGKSALYDTLDKKYDACESFLPTKYSQYLNKSNELYMRVRANYHTLWRLANEVKQRFFQDTSLMQMDLSTEKLYALQSLKLSVDQGKGLSYIYQLPPVKISKPEISGLIKGDIYDIIKKFLEEHYLDDALQDFSIIKMTGQSCRIDLFADSIKEFIPGRKIEFRQKETHMLDLKLSCLNGVLKYLHAKKTGIVHAIIENSTPITPYSVFAYTHKQEPLTLLSSSDVLTQYSGYISKYLATEEVSFYLTDVTGELQTTYLYINDSSSFSSTTYDYLKETYSEYINQADFDNIRMNELRLFVYATADAWGFNVVPVTRVDNDVYLGETQYFPFENEQWELNFFDGEK